MIARIRQWWARRGLNPGDPATDEWREYRRRCREVKHHNSLGGGYRGGPIPPGFKPSIPRAWTGCTCVPTGGFHQYSCRISLKMRRDLCEAGEPKEPPDPTKRAPDHSWIEFSNGLRGQDPHVLDREPPDDDDDYRLRNGVG